MRDTCAGQLPVALRPITIDWHDASLMREESRPAQQFSSTACVCSMLLNLVGPKTCGDVLDDSGWKRNVLISAAKSSVRPHGCLSLQRSWHVLCASAAFEQAHEIAFLESLWPALLRPERNVYRELPLRARGV